MGIGEKQREFAFGPRAWPQGSPGRQEEEEQGKD